MQALEDCGGCEPGFHLAEAVVLCGQDDARDGYHVAGDAFAHEGRAQVYCHGTGHAAVGHGFCLVVEVEIVKNQVKFGLY